MSAPTLLLVEPHGVARSTVAAVAKDLYAADHGLEVQPLSSVAQAADALARERYDLLFVALDDDGRALALLERLRAGELRAPPATPVVVSTSGCDAALAARLKSLRVMRVLLTPYKVKSVVEAVGQALGRHQAAARAQAPRQPAPQSREAA